MNDISYIEMSSLSDLAIEKEIGRFIKKQRQEQNMTQKELAAAANISRSTLSLLENGESGNLRTLIRLLRILNQLHLLKGFKYKEQISPLALAKMQHKPKERVKHTKAKKADNPKKSDW